MTTTSNKPDTVIRADHIPGPKQGNWTYYHYAMLPDDRKCYEIIDGVLYMAPAPNLWHQEVIGDIYAHLRDHVQLTGLGKVYLSPVDVQLAPNTVVEPDVVVVLKEHLEIAHRSRIIGAPDLVVEVASPSTAGYDRQEKRDRYARAGVSEYWIVDPVAQTLEILVLEGGGYQLLGIFKGQNAVCSKVVPTMADVRVSQFFL